MLYTKFCALTSYDELEENVFYNWSHDLHGINYIEKEKTKDMYNYSVFLGQNKR